MSTKNKKPPKSTTHTCVLVRLPNAVYRHATAAAKAAKMSRNEWIVRKCNGGSTKPRAAKKAAPAPQEAPATA